MVIKNPIVYSCLICIFLFYSGIFSIPERNPFSSLIPSTDISELYGEILNSPTKLSNGKYYSVNLKVYSSSNSSGFISTARGVIKVFLPVSLVESLYPGKIYSSSRTTGSFLCESGNKVKLKGKVVKTNSKELIFYCSSGEEKGWNKSISGKLNYLRAVCRLQLKRLLYAWGEAGGLLLALLTGSKEYTDLSTSEAFKKAGLSHILALSGMHLSIFSGISLFFGKKLKNYHFDLFAKPISIIAFVWFAGFSPSLLRAFICSVILIMYNIIKCRKPNMITVLCLSFLIQSVLFPSHILNTGFILSYGALFGILLLNNVIELIFIRFIPSKIASSLSASTSAQIFTAPVSLLFFGMICPSGIIASSIVSPLITLFIYSGLFLILINLMFPLCMNISGIFVNFLYTIIKNIVIMFSHLPIILIGD